jgi:hypothetical protein
MDKMGALDGTAHILTKTEHKTQNDFSHQYLRD